MTRLRMRKGGGSDECQSPWSLYPHAVDLPVQDVLRLVCVDIESYVIHLVSENLLAHVDVCAVKLAKGSEGLSCVMHRVAGAQRAEKRYGADSDADRPGRKLPGDAAT